MSELRALQETFAAALAGHAEREMRAAGPLFRGAPELTLARLAVYRGNIAGNTHKALADAYPVVVKIVGAEFFEGLAREYLRCYPSVSGDLNEYGGEFARFVAGFSHTLDLPYLPDVARLEWLVHRAHYAADAQPFDATRLAAISADAWSGLRPLLAPACALLESPWPLARVWEVHQDDYAGEFAVDLDAGPSRVLIQRPRFRVEVAAVAPGAYKFLQGAEHGDSVAAALAAALGADAGFDLAAALAAWVAAGVITGFEPAASD